MTSSLSDSNIRMSSPCENYAHNRKHAKYDKKFEGSETSSAQSWETLGAVNSEGEDYLRQIMRFAAMRLGYEHSFTRAVSLAVFHAKLPSRSVFALIASLITRSLWTLPPEDLAELANSD